MTVVADLTVPTEQFALQHTLATVPDIDVEFERIVTHSQEWIMPFLWVSGADLEAFDRAIHDDPTITEATLADTFDDGDPQVALYQIEWSEEVKSRINTIFDKSGTLIEAVGGRDEWELKVRFNDHDDLSALQSHFDQAETGFVVHRIYTPTNPRQPEFNVTAVQRDALVAALERGYYDVPRQTTMDDVANSMSVSTNALSERLRRGTANLIRTTLTVQDVFEDAKERSSDQTEPE